MERAAEAGVVFNSDKCTIKQTSISFFGNLYTDKGIRPDPAKIRDIQRMPTPQNLPITLHTKVCGQSTHIEGVAKK